MNICVHANILPRKSASVQQLRAIRPQRGQQSDREIRRFVSSSAKRECWIMNKRQVAWSTKNEPGITQPRVNVLYLEGGVSDLILGRKKNKREGRDNGLPCCRRRARRLSLSNFFMHVFFAAVFFLHIKDAKFENVRLE